MVDGDRVVFAKAVNYVTLENTKEILKNLKPKNCYGCNRIPLRILREHSASGTNLQIDEQNI